MKHASVRFATALAVKVLPVPGGANSLGNNKAIVIDGVAPAMPTALALNNPATSPGNDSTPSLTASSLTDGDVVRVHDNGSCTNLLLTSSPVSGGTVNFTIPVLTPGAHTFYIQARDPAGNNSPCSAVSVSYYYDNLAPGAPTIDVPNGRLFTAGFTATFGGGVDAEGHFDNFYYTLDGSAPTCGSTAGGTASVPAQGTSGDTITLRVVACDSAGNMSGEDSATYTWARPIVQNFYTNAPNWNDYVADPMNPNSAACNPANPCHHGGMEREVVLPNFGSCGDFAVVDNEGAFNWSACDDGSGTVKFRTHGFQSGKGLKDLLVPGAFKPFFVTITSANAHNSLDSVMGDPYGNSVSNLPVNSAAVETINTNGEIYTYTSDFESAGIHINGNGISIVDVSAGGAEIRFPTGGFGTNCNYNSGGPGSTAHCMIFSQGRDFLYFSGKIQGTADMSNFSNVGLYLHTVRHSIVETSDIEWGTDDGIYIKNSDRVVVSKVKVGNFYDAADVPGSTLGTGIRFKNGSFHRVHDIKTYNTGLAGVLLNGSIENKLIKGTVFNSGDHGVILEANSHANVIGLYNISNISDTGATGAGLQIANSNDNIVTGLTVANASEDGVQILAATKTILQNVTSVSNGATGLFSDGLASDNVYIQMGVFNNQNIGYWSNNSEDQFLSDFAAINNGAYGIQEDVDLSANMGGGTIFVGNNGTADCFTDAGSGFSDGNCAPANGSSHGVDGGLTSAGLFRGAFASVDYNTMTDWFTEITQPEGLWGQEGGAYPAADRRGACIPGETCEEFSYDYVSSNASLRGRLSTVHPNNNAAMTRPYKAGSVTFTIGAREMFKEEAKEFGLVIQPGNNNGVCETGESCVLTPNIGAYQGHDSLVRAGSKDLGGGGTIQNVEMWEYSTNGH